MTNTQVREVKVTAEILVVKKENRYTAFCEKYPNIAVEADTELKAANRLIEIIRELFRNYKKRQ